MNPIDKKAGAPALPAVNLIPQEIADATKMRAVRLTAMFAVLVAIGVVVAAYVLALGAKQLAKSDLEDALAQQETALTTRDGQKSVFDEYVAYEEDAYTLGQIGYGDVAVQDLTFSLLSTADETTSFSTVRFYGPTASGLGKQDSSETTVVGVGSFEFAGTAESYDDATALAARIEALPGIENVALVAEAYSSVGGSVQWGVEGNATVATSALTGRLAAEDALVEVQPDESIVEAAPSPSPSPSASEETE